MIHINQQTRISQMEYNKLRIQGININPDLPIIKKIKVS